MAHDFKAGDVVAVFDVVLKRDSAGNVVESGHWWAEVGAVSETEAEISLLGDFSDITVQMQKVPLENLFLVPVTLVHHNMLDVVDSTPEVLLALIWQIRALVKAVNGQTKLIDHNMEAIKALKGQNP